MGIRMEFYEATILVCLLLMGAREAAASCLSTTALDASALGTGRLLGPNMASLRVPTLVQCLALCEFRSLCLSVNYHAGSSSCEMIYKTLGEDWPAQLIAGSSSSSWVFVNKNTSATMEFARACSSEPCPDDNVCLPKGRNGRACVKAAVDCGAPPVRAYAQVSEGPTAFPSTVTYTCVLGSQALHGTGNKAHCLASGVWSDPAMQCIPNDCGPPPTFQNTTSNYTSTTYGSTVTYTCPPTFLMTADSSYSVRTCGADGQWSHADRVIFCAPTTCYIANPQAPRGFLYKGNVNVDVLGRLCQRWDVQSPYRHIYNTATWHAHDGGVANASNYCRIMNLLRPFCGTTQPNQPNRLNGSYAYCSVPLC